MALVLRPALAADIGVCIGISAGVRSVLLSRLRSLQGRETLRGPGRNGDRARGAAICNSLRHNDLRLPQFFFARVLAASRVTCRRRSCCAALSSLLASREWASRSSERAAASSATACVLDEAAASIVVLIDSLRARSHIHRLARFAPSASRSISARLRVHTLAGQTSTCRANRNGRLE